MTDNLKNLCINSWQIHYPENDCKEQIEKNYYCNKQTLSPDETPYYLFAREAYQKITEEFKKIISQTAVFQLDSKIDLTKVIPKMKLYTIIAQSFKCEMTTVTGKQYFGYFRKQITFIHIGKCGGTTICSNFAKNCQTLFEIHCAKPRKIVTDDIVIWIRHPLTRFVSAFNFAHNVIYTNIMRYKQMKIDDINIHNCINPYRIKKKIRTGRYFSPEYERLIKSFETPNNLAEALTDEDKKVRQQAHRLMNISEEHIAKNMSWYLDNGTLLDKYKDHRIFVGRLEFFQEDYDRVIKRLGLHMSTDIDHIRKNSNQNKFLSEKAVKNLLHFYKNTEYRVLRKMGRMGLIDKKTIELYHTYPIS